MKANARKILALIMAMVMCLSLAAPAFAAEEAVEDTSAETSTVETVETETETEEVEEEKVDKQEEKKDLKAQADNLVSAMAYKDSTDHSKGFTLTVAVEGNKDYSWSNNSDKYVSITVTGSDKALVGKENHLIYTATLKKDLVDSGATVDGNPYHETNNASISYDKTTAALKLNDSSIKWVEMSDAATVKMDSAGNNATSVKGYIYQEQEKAGTWNYYFKLYPESSIPGQFDTSADHKWVYKMASGTEELNTDAKIQAVVFGALQDVANTATTGMNDVAAATATYTITTARDQGTQYTYEYQADNTVVTVANGQSANSVSVLKDGTFSVKVTYSEAVNGTPVTKTVADADTIKSLLKVSGGTITNIAANASNGAYWDVTVKKDGADVSTEIDATTNTADADKKTSNYKLSASKTVIGLTDTANTGVYKVNADSKELTIASGTKVYGPVALTEDVPADVVKATSYNGALTKGTLFDSLKDLKDAVANNSCKESKTIRYKQLIMNAKVNGVENKGVALVTGQTNTYEAVTGWQTSTDAQVQVETGSFTLEANPAHFYGEKIDVVAPTCQKAGSVNTYQACVFCGKEKAGTRKTEVLPQITTAAVKTTKELGWVLKESLNSTDWAKLPKTVQGYYVGNGGTYTLNASNMPEHYIAKAEVTSVNNGDKATAGSYSVKYYCNCKVEHTELAETIDTGKTALEHSGKWDVIDWGVQNAADVRDVTKLYGYTPVVYDTDVDNAALTINGAADAKFAFASAGNKQTDGSYFATSTSLPPVTVVTKAADGKKTRESVNYLATMVVKDIKNGEKECQDGAATMIVTVYKTTLTNANSLQTPANVETAVKAGTLTVVNTFTKEYAIPAEKTHTYVDGVCAVCGAQQETPDAGKTNISTAVVKFDALTYTGKVAQPTVTVTLDGVKLAKDIDYEVEDFQETNAGTYDLIVAGKGLFSGRVVGKVKINKAAGKITASADKIQAKKNKAVKAKMSIKVTGGSVKAVKAKGVSGVKVSKTGVITVPKKCKGGTLKVTVSMKAKKNYKAAKAVTVKVKIKKAK